MGHHLKERLGKIVLSVEEGIGQCVPALWTPVKSEGTVKHHLLLISVTAVSRRE